jgi:hypothetical protein
MLDELAEAHEAAIQDALQASDEGRRDFQPEVFLRHCKAVNKLMPYVLGDENDANETSDWAHKPSDRRPDVYWHKSIIGRLKDIKEAVGVKANETIHNKGRSGEWWIVCHGRTKYEVFFRHHDDYVEANQSLIRLKERGVNPRKI